MGWRCDELSVWLLTVNYWSVLVVDWEIRRMSRCTLALLILAPLLLIDVIVCPPVTDKPLASTPAPAETDEDVVSISLPPSPPPLGNYIHSGIARGWKKRTAPDGSQEVRKNGVISGHCAPHDFWGQQKYTVAVQTWVLIICTMPLDILYLQSTCCDNIGCAVYLFYCMWTFFVMTVKETVSRILSQL